MHSCSRRRSLHFPFSVLLLLLVSGLPAQSQLTDDVHMVPRNSPGQSAKEADAISGKDEPTLDAHAKPLRVDVDLVLVPVVVTDPLNRPVTALSKQNFTLFDGGKEQPIRYFSVEDAPISIGLILDVSKSMTNKIDTERAAVREFFKNANPEDDFFVIAVSDRPRLVADSGDSISSVEQKLASTMPTGSTALLDSIYLGVSKLRAARYRRRALLIFSDGGDNSSRYTLKETKRLAQEADADIYAIGIYDSALIKPFEEFMGKRWLNEITGVTGGHTTTVDDLAKLPEAAAAISRELRCEYVLGYRLTSAARNGKWRRLQVRVTRPENASRLQAYYKKGYIAPEK
jgi:Ca-activated chloride channel family protein